MTEQNPNFATLADLIRHHARTRPSRVALVFDGGILTYGELDRRANQVANALSAEGVTAKSRIAILAKNDPAFFELLFGAAKIGAVPVPVNFRLAPPEVAYVLNDAGAELFFVGGDFYGVADQIANELKTVRRTLAIDQPHAAMGDYAAWRDAAPADDPSLPLAAEDVAMQMYTSGTTGYPKGAQLSHHNFMALLPLVVEQWGAWSDDDISLVCMPLFHIGGSGWALVGLYKGIPNVLMRDVDPKALLDLIPRHRVTRMFVVPAVILFMLQVPGCAEADFSSLELICYGASPMPLELLRKALAVFPCGFAQVYGLTETTGAITYLPPEDHADPQAERLKSCGKPAAEIEIRIRGAEGEDLPPRAVGEVVCRTPQVMVGYWNLPEASARAIRDGWFHTGDAGYLDEEGYLYIYDRVKDMVVSGGENIYPAEVENALFAHPAVADAAVIGVPDERWGEAVKAVVVLKPDAAATADELIAFARQRVAGFKAPRSVDFVVALPRNPSGKVLKRELREPYWIGRERQVN